MKKKILVAASLLLFLISSVSAANNTTTDSKTSILDETWSLDYCKSVDNSLENDECKKESFVVHPYRLGLYILLGFFGVGVLLKWYRTFVKGEPF